VHQCIRVRGLQSSYGLCIKHFVAGVAARLVQEVATFVCVFRELEWRHVAVDATRVHVDQKIAAVGRKLGVRRRLQLEKVNRSSPELPRRCPKRHTGSPPLVPAADHVFHRWAKNPLAGVVRITPAVHGRDVPHGYCPGGL